MANIILENETLKISITNKGAALQSLYNKVTELEYLWNGNKDFWAKQSPVLFPIIGGLKNNEYEYENRIYSLNRHGFARDNDFIAVQINDTKAVFTFGSNEKTEICYPFKFIFSVEYSIENDTVFCKYNIENKGQNVMYFSVGGHPAFNVPLTENTNFEDWFLHFNEIENCGVYPLTKDGLIKENSTAFFDSNNILPLKKSLFYGDALVFKELKSTEISIKSSKVTNGLTMQFNNFPYFGIWSAKDADFVCLEPWCGIADREDSNGNLINKQGIVKLDANNTFVNTWTIKLW